MGLLLNYSYCTMIESMTGFGRAERDGYRVEIRSVNHRYLDVYIKMPSYLNHLDMPFRQMLKEKLSRGKVDVTVTVSEQASTEYSFDSESVGKMLSVFRRIQTDFRVAGEIDINSLVGLHEMFIRTTTKIDDAAVFEVFQTALDDLLVMRKKEGEALGSELFKMAGLIKVMNCRLRELSGSAVSETRDKFSERLRTLLDGAEADQSRILQEAAIIAARLDIAEEITRIESHLGRLADILQEGGIIGRKLDFILQELNREVNTAASKSGYYDLSSLTVDMKTELEKMREQVQNIQ